MKSLVVLFALASLAVVYAQDITPVETILPDVYMEPAVNNYTYQAAIYSEGSKRFFCGGSVLNERYILTSASCLVNADPKDVKVVVGVASLKGLDKDEDFRPVQRLILHEGFSYHYSGYKNNIGLIQLMDDIVFDGTVAPIDLPRNDNINGNFTAVTSGWLPTKVMLQTTHNVTSYETCATSRSDVRREHICIEPLKALRAVCPRDMSGNPLVINSWEQIGILSSGGVCGEAGPIVYTRVYHHLDWIEKKL